MGQKTFELALRSYCERDGEEQVHCRTRAEGERTASFMFTETEREEEYVS
jgi:hypothetical protein